RAMPTSSTSSTANIHLPNWYHNQDAARLPDSCRVKCDTCHGHGSEAGQEMVDCYACQHGEMACVAHKCAQCGGSGFVCPACRGMRFVRSQVWKHSAAAHQNARDIDRCTECCRDNKVEPFQERKAINDYLMRWRTHTAEAQARGERYVEPRQAKLDAEAAAYKQLVPSNGPTRSRKPTPLRRKVDDAPVAESKPTPPPSSSQPVEAWRALPDILRSQGNSDRERARQAIIERNKRQQG
ncbi:MAG TPA: hypothetical protein VFN11_17805, partial [Ktedonobacterales bacterium]|nr:hypothetical protein [Ktedonobacterales bacterium]